MPNPMLASIIIPTWNGMAFIEACLEAVAAQSYSPVEVIVVDNASTDGTPQWVAAKFPAVDLIRNDQNLGFAAAANIGLTRAEGDILVLLNQDTIVAPAWLAELMRGMAADLTVGVGGCKIFDWTGDKLWHTGIDLAGDRKFPTLRGCWEEDVGQYDQDETVETVVGAALAIRRELLDTVGLFDENFYFYLEDTDYCLRAKKAGYKIMYYHRATLRHYVAASLEKGSYDLFYRFNFSRLLFLLKHFSLDWFCDTFAPAEKARLQDWVSLNELKALRQVYLNTALQIASGNPAYGDSPALSGPQAIDRAVKVLTDLQNSAVPPLQMSNDWHEFDQDVSEKWVVAPHEFRSNVPLIGPLLAGFRRAWSSVAAGWIEKNILQQQVVINYEMIMLLREHDKELSFQRGLITMLEADVANLSEQLVELTRRQGHEAKKRDG